MSDKLAKIRSVIEQIETIVDHGGAVENNSDELLALFNEARKLTETVVSVDLYDRNGPENGCRCAVCWPRYPWFRTCPHCGNKRCPKAADHRFKCTRSNDTDQVGVLEEGS